MSNEVPCRIPASIPLTNSGMSCLGWANRNAHSSWRTSADKKFNFEAMTPSNFRSLNQNFEVERLARLLLIGISRVQYSARKPTTLPEDIFTLFPWNVEVDHDHFPPYFVILSLQLVLESDWTVQLTSQFNAKECVEIDLHCTYAFISYDVCKRLPYILFRFICSLRSLEMSSETRKIKHKSPFLTRLTQT